MQRFAQSMAQISIIRVLNNFLTPGAVAPSPVGGGIPARHRLVRNLFGNDYTCALRFSKITFFATA